MVIRERPLRTVIEEPEFETQRALIMPDAKRFDEIANAIVFGLARKPEVMGFHIPGTEVWVHTTRAFAESGAPSLEFTYAFDDERVWLRWLEETPKP